MSGVGTRRLGEPCRPSPHNILFTEARISFAPFKNRFFLQPTTRNSNLTLVILFKLLKTASKMLEIAFLRPKNWKIYWGTIPPRNHINVSRTWPQCHGKFMKLWVPSLRSILPIPVNNKVNVNLLNNIIFTCLFTFIENIYFSPNSTSFLNPASIPTRTPMLSSLLRDIMTVMTVLLCSQ